MLCDWSQTPSAYHNVKTLCAYHNVQYTLSVIDSRAYHGVATLCDWFLCLPQFRDALWLVPVLTPNVKTLCAYHYVQ